MHLHQGDQHKARKLSIARLKTLEPVPPALVMVLVTGMVLAPAWGQALASALVLALA